jgi:hypothetical protein
VYQAANYRKNHVSDVKESHVKENHVRLLIAFSQRMPHSMLWSWSTEEAGAFALPASIVEAFLGSSAALSHALFGQTKKFLP